MLSNLYYHVFQGLGLGVRNGCEGNGGGHYVIIIILYLENADSYNMYKTQ